jgi:site-specific recombinase XerD
MINRQNWLDIRDYLRHCERRQNEPKTVDRYRNSLRHLLEWAQDSPLVKARTIDPTFPTYLCSTSLSPASINKCLGQAKRYFSFARTEWPSRYKSLSDSWIDLLQAPRQMRMQSRLPLRQLYTLEEVRTIAAVSTETLHEERGKVAACMLFLSGMRADALASLPIGCVDLQHGAIHQLPESGVRTKNRKAAITYLLQIPELLQVVHRWDHQVRHALPASALWYSTLSQDGTQWTSTEIAFEGRYHILHEDVKLICDLAGVTYRSPHKFRHGHAVYALKRAQNMAQLKAISQNIMHKSVSTTDAIYGNLITDEVHDIIAAL